MKTASNIEEHKTLVRRFFTAIENGDFRVFDEIVAENYNDHLAGQTPGRETLKRYFTGLRSAFADFKLPITAMVAEGNLVAVLNSVRGTHKGDFAGIKAKGNSIDAMAFQLYRIANGQLAEHWEVADFTTLMRATTKLIRRQHKTAVDMSAGENCVCFNLRWVTRAVRQCWLV